jgi:hypothetical protein
MSLAGARTVNLQLKQQHQRRDKEEEMEGGVQNWRTKIHGRGEWTLLVLRRLGGTRRRWRVENNVFFSKPSDVQCRAKLTVTMKGLQLQLSHDDEFITVTGEYHLFEEERPFALDLVDSAAALENAMRCSSPPGVDVRVGGPQWQWQWASGSIKGSSDRSDIN